MARPVPGRTQGASLLWTGDGCNCSIAASPQPEGHVCLCLSRENLAPTTNPVHSRDAACPRPGVGGGAKRTAALARAGGRLGAVLAGLLLLCLIFPHMSGVVHAASMGSAGRVSGQLLNGSHNNAPVANQSVTLQMAQGNNSRDLVTITTDAQGHYTFGALESDSSVQYAVYTLYQGAQYFTNLIDLSKNANQQVNLTVYDATTSTANLAVVQASILLDKPNQQSGTLNVSEDFFFENL
ncbi:MAG TPA: hypothetical protein VH164_02265, partial [Ktedonobacteraceae bacterium]|nr:hypothetical protein [Ktedonobacteraceae bacterium]